MFNLVIVDDEIEIRNGLKAIVPWAKMGFNVVGCFKNGKETIEYLQDNSVDVILLDIVMGDISGLDVAAWIKNQDIKTKIVVLSGFSDFQYAKKSIDYGVVAYLLKPTDIDELLAVFQSIRIKLEEESKIDSISIRQMNREIAIRLLLTNNYDYDSSIVQKLWPDIININNGYINIIQFDNYDNALRAKKIINDQFELLQGVNFGLCSINDKLIIIILNNSQILLYELINEKIEFLITSWNSIYSIQSELRLKLNSSDLMNTIINDMRMKLIIESNDKNMTRMIDDIIQTYQGENDHAIFEKIESIDQTQINILQKLYFFFALEASKYSYAFTDSVVFKENKIYDILFKTSEGILMKNEIIKLIEYIHNHKSLNLDIVDKIIAIYKNTVDYTLSLAEIANKTGYHPNYLSRVFKNKYGITFNKFHIINKIKKAEELLANTDIKINQISQMLGYNDIRHFYKVFRTINHETPSQFRKRVCGNDQPVN